MGMSDWRYHIASLSAVLLSLAVGLLIGGLYLSPAVPDQIAAQLKRLDAQLAERTAELRQAEAERENLRQALARADSLIAHLLTQKTTARPLKGRRFALLVTTDEPSLAQGVERLLSEAGAEPLSITQIDWARIDPQEQSLILKNLPDLYLPGMSNGARVVLSRRRGVSLYGDYTRTPDILIWVGGYTGNDAPEEWLQQDSELIGALQTSWRNAPHTPRLVACEGFTARLSILPLCKAADLPAVDCVDFALGKAMLLTLLQGESGIYGLKPEADAPFPSTLLEQRR
jgi:hypothetical protein